MDSLGYKMVIVNKHESQFMLARMPAVAIKHILTFSTPFAGILASIN